MNRIITTLLALLIITNVFAQGDDRPENTGDNFSLEGALALFKKSSSLEEFEKMLNEEGNHVNNLDLNNDGQVDYIAVNDIHEGDAHAIVLSIYLSDNDQQDIAIIGIEKTGFESARIQIEGDTDLFPEKTIVEPVEDSTSFQIQNDSFDSFSFDKTNNKIHGPYFDSETSIAADFNQQVFVNVWFWPSVRVLYAPGYVAWRSPWRWGLYPKWWRPWRPRSYGIFYRRSAPYRVHFRYAPNRNTTIIKTNPRGRVKAVRIKKGRRGRRF